VILWNVLAIATAIFFVIFALISYPVQTPATFPQAAPLAHNGPLITNFVVRLVRFTLFALVSLGISDHMLAQNEFPTDEMVATETVFWPDSVSIGVAKGIGTAKARRDIQAGVFRSYVYDHGGLATALLMFDPETGYRVNRVVETNADGKPSDAFVAWLEAYNQVMREWHDSHN
jgi:hypothetical protein